jgi:hypothetical protein
MHIMPNAEGFPGAPEDLLIGRWAPPDAPSGRPWRLIAVGDIGLSGHVAAKAHQLGHASHIFRHVRPAIQAGDCAIGSLACALLKDRSADTLFAGDTAWADDLWRIGDLLRRAVRAFWRCFKVLVVSLHRRPTC